MANDVIHAIHGLHKKLEQPNKINSAMAEMTPMELFFKELANKSKALYCYHRLIAILKNIDYRLLNYKYIKLLIRKADNLSVRKDIFCAIDTNTMTTWLATGEISLASLCADIPDRKLLYATISHIQNRIGNDFIAKALAEKADLSMRQTDVRQANASQNSACMGQPCYSGSAVTTLAIALLSVGNSTRDEAELIKNTPGETIAGVCDLLADFDLKPFIQFCLDNFTCADAVMHFAQFSKIENAHGQIISCLQERLLQFLEKVELTEYLSQGKLSCLLSTLNSPQPYGKPADKPGYSLWFTANRSLEAGYEAQIDNAHLLHSVIKAFLSYQKDTKTALVTVLANQLKQTTKPSQVAKPGN